MKDGASRVGWAKSSNSKLQERWESKKCPRLPHRYKQPPASGLRTRLPASCHTSSFYHRSDAESASPPTLRPSRSRSPPFESLQAFFIRHLARQGSQNQRLVRKQWEWHLPHQPHKCQSTILSCIQMPYQVIHSPPLAMNGTRALQTQ